MQSARKFTFIFSRISIVFPREEDKNDIYHYIFLSNTPVSDKYYKYIFIDSKKVFFNQEPFYFGRLVKYKNVEEEVVIESHQAIGTKPVDDAVIAKAEYILHPFTGILAFRPIPNKISPKQFREKFARLIETSYENFFISVKIESINEDYKIQEIIRQFKIIFSINIELHPSNPSNRDLWKNTDKRLNNLGAIEFQEKIIGGESGLNKENVLKDEIISGVAMAADGYGFASAEGTLDNGQKIVVTTADNPTYAKASIDEEPQNLIKQLIRSFQDIWTRTKNESDK